jgi:hypothetical protein
MVPVTPLQLALMTICGLVLAIEHIGVLLNPLPTLHDIGVTIEILAGKVN